MDSNYFSWANLHELLDLDSHAAYAEDLIGKYHWAPKIGQDFTTRLNTFREKQHDKYLNLSVIGEFSSGKSTFINALLRTELLEAGILQGTTIASTLIEHSPTPSLRLRFHSGKLLQRSFASLQELRTCLAQIIAEAEYVKLLRDITIGLPSPTLEQNSFRIIDTPGLDATEHWHEGVTVRTLQDTSDLSIILVDAVRPLPDSLCQFVTQHLESILDQCIFVVTKMDLIPPRERKMMLRYVEQSAKAKFNMEAPLVLPYSSMQVLSTFLPQYGEDAKYPSDPVNSEASETAMIEHMARQRAIAQSVKLLTLIDRLFDAVQSKMKQMQTNYRQFLEILDLAKPKDMAQYVARQKEACCRKLDENSLQLRSTILPRIDRLTAQAKLTLLSKITASASTEALKHYVRTQLSNDIREQAGLLGVEISKIMEQDDTLRSCFHGIYGDFLNAFHTQFNRLQWQMFQKQKELQIPSHFPAPDSNSFRLSAQDVNSQPGRPMAGIGHVGTLAAGFSSGLLPSSSRLEKQKEQIRTGLSAPLDIYFSAVSTAVTDATDQYISQVRAALCAQIDSYFAAYRTATTQWLRKESARRQLLQDRITTLQEDLRQLGHRKDTLDLAKKQLFPSV